MGSSAFAARDAIVVELRLAALDVTEATLERLRELLSVDERERADARIPRERRRFVADHGYRRLALGAALGCEARAVAYDVSPEGKPALAGGRLRFSASRSGAVGLYALSESADVGVDVELIPRDPELGQLAARVMTPSERAAFEAVAPAGRAAALAACWTRKEAHGKALGIGLVFPLTEVEVWAGDERPVRCGGVVVHSVDLSGVLSGLSHADAHGGGGLAASVAVRADPRVRVSIAAPTRVALPPLSG